MWGIDGMYIAGADGSGHQIALAGHRLVIAGFHDPLNNSHRPDAFAKRVVHRDWRQAHDVWRAKIRDHSCAAKCFADSRCVGATCQATRQAPDWPTTGTSKANDKGLSLAPFSLSGGFLAFPGTSQTPSTASARLSSAIS